MVDLTPEQQAARDAMIARRQPALTAEQQSARDAMLSRRPEPVGMAEAAVRLPVSSLTRGVSYLAGAPRAISDLAGAGGNYLMEKVGVPEVLRKTIGEGLAFANPLSGAPKAETMIKGASDLTGGFTDYEATTPGGKALGKAIEFAPSRNSCWVKRWRIGYTSGTYIWRCRTSGGRHWIEIRWGRNRQVHGR
jgi:hypothetical protein